MNILLEKLKEVTLSVLPITLLVIILNFTLVPLDKATLVRFTVGAAVLVVGLGIFLFGAQIGIVPIGRLMGETIARTNKMHVVAILGFVLGFLITAAEPDVQILSQQVDLATGGVVSSGLFLVVVSVGVGIMVAVGLARILYSKPLNVVFTVAYLVILLAGLKASEEFLAFSVDASGATTGAMTTPFILALSYGVSQLKGGKTQEEDSFGMVGQASAGPIFAIMIMSIIKGLTHLQVNEAGLANGADRTISYVEAFPRFAKESCITLLPLLILFLIFNRTKFNLSRKASSNILKGLLYAFLGLTLFMVGVNAGFMEVGRIMGEGIAKTHLWMLPVIGFLLGMVVVLAEPAVYVLTEQVEEVTAGHIKRKVLLVALSAGIALAVCGSMLRIMIPALKLWHFLLPGFALGAILSYRVPPIFVGIAYDAGGVASGPMTATFILAFAQGAAGAIPTANILVDGFGVIAMVAMAPLVAIQTLGLIFKVKTEGGESA